MTEMRRTPEFMTTDELANALTRLAEAIRAGDSLEGNFEYLLPDEEHPGDGAEGGCPHVMVTAAYRVGNRQGQGGMQFIGGWEPAAEVPTQALRDRLEHAIRARLTQAWPPLDDAGQNNWLDQVAAVAAVAAVNDLREG